MFDLTWGNLEQPAGQCGTVRWAGQVYNMDAASSPCTTLSLPTPTGGSTCGLQKAFYKVKMALF